MFRDHRQMTITLCRWISVTTQNGCRAQWDHRFDAIAMGSNYLVSGVTVILPIGRDPANRAVNLIEQRAPTWDASSTS